MNITRRVEQLEETMNRAGACCNHLPPIVREIDINGNDITGTQFAANDAVCDCGRDRLEIHLRETDQPRTVVLLPVNGR